MPRGVYLKTEEHRRNLSKAHLGKKLSKEHKRKLSKAHLGKKMLKETREAIIKANSGKNNYAWKGGKPKCPNCGRELSTYTVKQCQKCYLKSNKFKKHRMKITIEQQNFKEPTSIEKKVYDELRARGILFERQKLVNGRFVVDAYIPSLNLIIEADGDYWHSLSKTVKKDKAENAYLKACGFNLLRLTETEINSEEFKNRLPL